MLNLRAALVCCVTFEVAFFACFLIPFLLPVLHDPTCERTEIKLQHICTARSLVAVQRTWDPTALFPSIPSAFLLHHTCIQTCISIQYTSSRRLSCLWFLEIKYEQKRFHLSSAQQVSRSNMISTHPYLLLIGRNCILSLQEMKYKDYVHIQETQFNFFHTTLFPMTWNLLSILYFKGSSDFFETKLWLPAWLVQFPQPFIKQKRIQLKEE